MFWVVYGVVAASAVVGWNLLRRSDIDETYPVVEHLRHRARLSAHVVFVDRTEDVVTLDCVVTTTVDADSVLPPGMPFTILAELPLSEPWATNASADVLNRWVTTGAVVDIDIINRASGAAVRMSDPSTRLQLGMAA